MTTTTLKALFKRDLERLKDEIKAYQKEEILWSIAQDIKNSGGNLCLHLIGNLNHFIGAAIAKTGYIRQRELEFSSKHVDRSEIYIMIDDTITMVHKGLDKLTPDQLQQTYPITFRDEGKSTEFMIMHLYAHLNYHLGQINYHRRMLDQAK